MGDAFLHFRGKNLSHESAKKISYNLKNSLRGCEMGRIFVVYMLKMMGKRTKKTQKCAKYTNI